MAGLSDNATETSWDVAVIGAGPAGSATAITLARLGQRVLLADEQGGVKPKLGESLPPSCVGLVTHFLGTGPAPEDSHSGMFRTAGNVSVWATEQAQTTDFFFTQTGFGLCIDRVAFDEAMRSRAVEAGVTLLKGVRFEACSRLTESAFSWQLQFGRGAPVHRARYLVDCSGRRAAVARTLGGSLCQDPDGLFAYAQWFATCGPDDDRYTRIEAGPQGWWYSNRLPGENEGKTSRLVVFHTDNDLPHSTLAATPHGFQHVLGYSAHIGPWLDQLGYRPVGPVRGAAANSQRLQSFCGDAWMAVGDAAQAYDPLSSQGIYKALESGSQAGHFIHYALSESPAGPGSLGHENPYISQYAAQQQRLWENYSDRRNFFYQQQPR